MMSAGWVATVATRAAQLEAMVRRIEATPEAAWRAFGTPGRYNPGDKRVRAGVLVAWDESQFTGIHTGVLIKHSSSMAYWSWGFSVFLLRLIARCGE